MLCYVYCMRRSSGHSSGQTRLLRAVYAVRACIAWFFCGPSMDAFLRGKTSRKLPTVSEAPLQKGGK